MRVLGIFISMSLMLASIAQATVIEFNEDGTVLKHEAYDYRSTRGEGQYEILMPAIMKTPLPSYAFGMQGYESAIQNAAMNYNLSASLLRAVIHTESAGKSNAVSPKGAQGLMQLMPATARQYGVSDPFDPEQNIDGGAKYLSYLFTRYSGDTKLALAAYNAGEGTVDRYGGVPPYAETRAYVKKIEYQLKNTSKN